MVAKIPRAFVDHFTFLVDTSKRGVGKRIFAGLVVKISLEVKVWGTWVAAPGMSVLFVVLFDGVFHILGQGVNGGLGQ